MLSGGPASNNILRLLINCILLLFFIVFLIHLARILKNSKICQQQRWFLLAIPILMAAQLLIFSKSHFSQFSTCRYLLPMFPALAVGIAIAARLLIKKSRGLLGWIPILCFLVFQLFPAFSFVRTLQQNQTAVRLQTQQLLQNSTNLTEQVFFGSYENAYWLNYTTDEKFCIVEPGREKYAPYEKKAELADSVGILNSYGESATFLQQTAASYSLFQSGPFSIIHNIIPPNHLMISCDPQDFTIHDNTGTRIRSLTDSNAESVFLPQSASTQHPCFANDPTVQPANLLWNRTAESFRRKLPYTHFY